LTINNPLSFPLQFFKIHFSFNRSLFFLTLKTPRLHNYSEEQTGKKKPPGKHHSHHQISLPEEKKNKNKIKSRATSFLLTCLEIDRAMATMTHRV
jgi:hypothetical protein